MLRLETAGLSDIGRKRGNNEDAFLVDDGHGLYIVADGMGGHLAGEVASAIVVDSMKAAACGPGGPLPAEARLLGWIRQANKSVYQRSLSDEQYRGMGSTVAALYVDGDHAVAANVGDSPVYLVRSSRIEMLSAMHTVAAERTALYPQGLGLPVHFHHMLTRAVGIDADVEPYILETDCRTGDAFILCSDGLSNALQPEELSAIVRRCGADEACARLVELANARGGDDNITVIVIKVLKR